MAMVTITFINKAARVAAPLFVFFVIGSPCVAQVNWFNDEYVRAFETKINDYRKTKTLAPLAENARLNRVAEHHAEYLTKLCLTKPDAFQLTHDEFVKVDGVQALGSLEKRFEKFGFTQGYGECIAYFDENSLPTPDALMELWQTSSTHDRLMRGRSFERYGLVVLYVPHESHVVTIAVLTLATR